MTLLILTLQKNKPISDPFAEQRYKKPKVSGDRENNIDTEIQSYEHTLFTICSAEMGNPLLFWFKHKDRYPILSKIACSVFVIPASSAESERGFSDAGIFLTKGRASLILSTIEAQLMIYSQRSKYK